MDLGLILASVPEGRMFALDMQTFTQVGAQLINLAILAFVMAKLLYRPVRKALQKRTDRIQGQLAQAAEEMEKATEMKLLYEQKIAEVQRERDDILSEARRLASDTSQRLVADAKKEADAVRSRAAVNVEMEWERAESEMRTAVIEVSALMAEKFVKLAIDKETHNRLFEETMADLEEIKWRG